MQVPMFGHTNMERSVYIAVSFFVRNRFIGFHPMLFLFLKTNDR